MEKTREELTAENEALWTRAHQAEETVDVLLLGMYFLFGLTVGLIALVAGRSR